MDLSLPSTSSCDPSDRGDAGNGEGLAIDEIMRMKEKRLKLLDDYRNEQEENILPLMREADDINKKRKKKSRTQTQAENNIPLRRSERIMTQTLNENGTVESPMHQPELEPEPVPEIQHEPELEPQLALREVEPEPPIIVESESESESGSEDGSGSDSGSEEGSGTEYGSDDMSESISGLSEYSPSEPLFSDDSERELELTDESDQELAITDESNQENPPSLMRIVQRGSSATREFEVRRPRRHRFDVQLASRRVFAVYPAPNNVAHRRGRHPALRVNDNWYGPREGFDIGHQWNTRLECSHDRVHRPSIAGIHAGPYGAYSVALSGAYPEDIDRGNVVIFTGAGGRDLRGRRGRSRSVRSAPQVRDQELNKANLSLIKSVRTGNPVRLIRGHKLASSYAPERGYRYDGLYRVVHFCYTRGYSGFRVFRFKMFRLQNQNPPPWETARRLAVPRGMLPGAPGRAPNTSEGPRTRRRAREENNRASGAATVGELDDEIERYIRELTRGSPRAPAVDNGHPSTPFRGWSMP